MSEESITDYLKRRLRAVGAARFEEIAAQTGVAGSFIRKFVYGSRQNPRIQTIQPLLDYFAAEDRQSGCAQLVPEPAPLTIANQPFASMPEAVQRVVVGGR